ncbi:hypothetical protein L7F22_049280 [Adiantum nelumboides]|nr:hypothetical protein [Adiantum nelumboides]
MASRRVCATVTKGSLRVLCERSTVLGSATCEAHPWDEGTTALYTIWRPLNAVNLVPRSLQRVRFFARVRGAPSPQPRESTGAPSSVHASTEDDDEADDDEDDDNKQKQNDEETEDNHTFLFGKYDNDYSDDDDPDYFVPDITTDYDDD